jgi:hypothetical protein
MNDGTLKVTPITSAQPQAVAKFSITASIDGFPITVEVEGKADALRGMIDRLKAIGATPPASQPMKPEPTNEDAPVCEFHGKMKASSARPGTFFCPKKMGDGSYCKSKA